MTRLACDRCREIEARGGAVPEWAKDWWADHKRADIKRSQQDAAAQLETVIRARALAKLTPEERAELGL